MPVVHGTHTCVFYKHFFNNNIIYTTHLLYEMTNIESFNVVRDAGLKNSKFLVWTGLRQSVPLKLRVQVPNFENILDLEKFKCRNYYHLLIKKNLIWRISNFRKLLFCH